MKIVGWTEFDNSQYEDMFPIGGSYTMEEVDEAKDIIAKELRDKGYKFNGYYHQDGDYGVPIFENGEAFRCTFRTWGGIMARAYPDEIDNSDGLGYCDWAWDIPENQKMVVPCEEDYII